LNQTREWKSKEEEREQERKLVIKKEKGVEQTLQRTRVVGSFALAENPRR
jgi:hypothetical protein